MCKWVLLLQWLLLRLVSIQKLTSKINKIKHFPFKKKIDSSLCHSLSNKKLLHQVLENAILRQIIH